MKVIKCPKCGREYLVEEIFLPEDFLGTSDNVVRDDNGVIIDKNGDDASLVEEYCCDNCGCNFEVTATVDFEVNPIEDNFDEETTISIYSDRITLDK